VDASRCKIRIAAAEQRFCARADLTTLHREEYKAAYKNSLEARRLLDSGDLAGDPVEALGYLGHRSQGFDEFFHVIRAS
jgi:hypothetical protein